MMNSLVQSPFSVCRTDLLRGGKAPAYWKRDLSRQTTRLSTVLRTCAWLKELAEVQPSVFAQPIFGSCLGEITSGSIARSDLKKTETSRAGARSNPLVSGSRRTEWKGARSTSASILPSTPAMDSFRSGPNNSESSQLSDQTSIRGNNGDQQNIDDFSPLLPPAATSNLSQSRVATNSLSHLPPQADRSLLERFAGTPIDVFSEKDHSSDQASPVLRNVPGSSPSSSPLLPVLGHQDWRHLIAYRAGKRWLRNWPSATRSVATVPAFFNEPLQRSTPTRNFSPLLVGQWSTSLIGQRVPPEVLSYLVKELGSDDARRASEIKPARIDTERNGKFSPVRSEFSGQSPSAEQGNWNHSQQNFAAKHFERFLPDREQRSLTQDLDQSFPSRPEQPVTTDELEWQSSSKYAPPAMAPSLPPLHTARAPDATPMHVASATARQGASRAEAVAQEQDLSLLAAQMKRILDDEARRHGVDV